MPGGKCILIFLVLLSVSPNSADGGQASSGSRRVLHQPFFPTDSGTPSPPPEFTPVQMPLNSPFFPADPAITLPPPSTVTPDVTLPANISGLTGQTPPGKKNSSSVDKKVIIPVVLVIVGVAALLGVVLVFRRRHTDEFPRRTARSTSVRLYPANNSGDVKIGVVPNGADVLYLGTLGNSRLPPDGGESGGGGNSPYHKLVSPESYHPRSPELQPLPPLSRQCRSESSPGTTDDESFYSPRGSSSAHREESPSSRKVYYVVASPARAASGSSNSSTPSYPSSKSSSPLSSKTPSPKPGPKSPVTEFSARAGGFRPPPPLSPPLLERRHSLPSPPSSPSDRSTASSSGKEEPPPLVAGKQPPPPPPLPPKGSLWNFPVLPPPPTRPISGPPQLLTPPRNLVQRTSSEDSLEGKSISSPSPPHRNSPPPPTASFGAGGEKIEESPKPKLKPLHWDKVRASSDRAMVWDQLKSSSFKLNEEMIETLFVCKTPSSAVKEAATRKTLLPSPIQENRVLDPKKSQNIAILLRALNVTREEVCEALTEGNAEGLGTELLETLLKMAPTKEEEVKLKEHEDDPKLGTAERFLKAVLDVPYAFKRVDAMLYIANFESEVAYLRKSFETLEAACEELRTSRLFLKLLEAVLKTGNRMNVGTNRGDAHAFKLDTLLKLVDVKGTDGKTTLLHFVVQEIIRSEGAYLAADNIATTTTTPPSNSRKPGLRVVAALSSELGNVKKSATMDSDVLSSYVSKLASGLDKLTEVLQTVDSDNSANNTQFVLAVSSFLHKAEEEILRIRAEESVALSLVKEITEYFHGNTVREEAHPFRIFVIVRDFLDVLDRVCKDVGKMQEQPISIVTGGGGGGRQFPVPVNPMNFPIKPAFHAFRRRWTESDDDSESSSKST